LKASEVAIGIRDNERNGRASLQMVEDGSEPEAILSVSLTFFYKRKKNYVPVCCKFKHAVCKKNEDLLWQEVKTQLTWSVVAHSLYLMEHNIV